MAYPPIFIPSRGRSRQQRGTLHNLVAANIPATVVVEPHEVALYQALVDSLIAASRQQAETELKPSDEELPPRERFLRSSWPVVSLPLSDQGVSYVRNFILHTLAPKAEVGRGDAFFWVMDDDIRDFFRADGKANVKVAFPEMLQIAFERAKLYPDAAIFSLEYSFFAYTYVDTSVAINSYNNIAVLFNRRLLPQQLQYRWRIREDYDFTLQLIRAGGKTVRFRNLSFNVPRMKDIKGGMTEFYESKTDEICKANKVFVAEWCSVAREVIKGTGDKVRRDIQVKWVMLNPVRCADPAAVLRSKVPLPAVASQPHSQRHESRKRARGKRRRGSSSSDTEEDEETEESDSDGSDESQAAVRSRAPCVVRVRPPRPKAPLREKTQPGWKGYGLEEWRDVPDAVATDERIGLKLLAPHEIKLGTSCAIIPVWMSVAQNLLVVTVIEVARRPPAAPEWTGVAGKEFRGVPLQTFSKAYAIPADLAEKDAAIGRWLSGLWTLDNTDAQ